MNKFTLSISAAIFALATPTAVFAEHHAGGHEGHKCEKMEDGKMKCCKKDKEGKMVCSMKDAAKKDHGDMDHGNMDHGDMNQAETPDADPS